MTDTHALAGETTDGQPRGRVAALRHRVIGLARDTSHAGMARRAALFVFGVRVASAAIAYVAQVILARWMGTSDYGIYVFVWTWVLMLGNLSGLGFGMASGRFVPEHTERGDLARLRGYMLSSRLAGFAMGTALAMAGIAAIVLLGDRIAAPMVWPLVLALICLPMFAIGETQDGIGRAMDAPGVALLPPYVLRPLLILGFMVVAHEGGWPSNATTAMICAVAATWLASVVQLIALQRRIHARVAVGPRTLDWRLWLGASLPLCLADGARVALLNVDVVILAAFATPDQVGIYFAVTKTLVLGAFVGFAVSAAVAHRYAEYHISGDRERLQRFVLQTAAWTFWPTLLAVIAMLALGRPFLALFGEAFLAGYPLMIVLSLGVIARAALGPTDRLLGMMGQHGIYARVLVTTLVIACGLHLLLVPMFGALGSAMATSAAAVLEGLLLAWIARSRLGLRVGIWNTFRRSA